jgi:hypothetical protein
MKMTRNTNMIALAAGMFFMAATGFFATVSEASTGNVLNCKGNSRDKVVDCCQQIVRKKKPVWMVEARQSCGTAAVCSAKSIKGTSITHVTKPKKVLVCSIAMSDKPDKPDKPDTPDKPDKPDNPNNPDRPDSSGIK